MKNAKKIGNIGQLLMILGSAMYLVELLAPSVKQLEGLIMNGWTLTVPICCVYAVALVLMLIGWLGTAEERRAAREAAKAAKEK